jgi:hypothetical protein
MMGFAALNPILRSAALHPGYDRLRAIGFVLGEDEIDAAADELVHGRIGRRR